MPKTNLLARQLERFARLSIEDERALRDLARERLGQGGPRQDVVRQGEKPRRVKLFLDGWACRYKMLEDGRRQIVAFLLPGDLCDLNVCILRGMDHYIGALTPVTFADIDPDRIERVMADHPRVTQALLWEALVAISIQREWTVNVGQRSAFERVAHLLCELFVRLGVVGLAGADGFELPLTQAELGDATGLSAVHVNRTLQDLRNRSLILSRGKELVIPDFPALQDAAQFNAGYLHLDGEGRQHDANEAW